VGNREEKGGGLSPLDLWILLILRAADGWIRIDKVMAVAFLVEKIYGLTGAAFRPSGGVPWSVEVEAALKRLALRGFADELPEDRGYRLSGRGRRAVRKILGKIPPRDPKPRCAYLDATVLVRQDVRGLAEYIRGRYPEYAAGD
jgi:hypothetical protein